MSEIANTYLYTSAQKTTKTRILKTNFGDGYSQRAGDGINTTPDSWTVEFRSTSGNIGSIVTILETKAGHTYFTWTPPGGSEQKWVCSEWTYALLGKSTYSLSATFEEVFDLT
jgi:phage-related protein